MIYISYDNQIYSEVYNNYQEVLDAICDKIISENGHIDGGIVCDFLMNVYIKGMPVFAQMELFKDVYNELLEDCISMITEDGEFI